MHAHTRGELGGAGRDGQKKREKMGVGKEGKGGRGGGGVQRQRVSNCHATMLKHDKIGKQ